MIDLDNETKAIEKSNVAGIDSTVTFSLRFPLMMVTEVEVSSIASSSGGGSDPKGQPRLNIDNCSRRDDDSGRCFVCESQDGRTTKSCEIVQGLDVVRKRWCDLRLKTASRVRVRSNATGRVGR
jgi:hypothetical protein